MLRQLAAVLVFSYAIAPQSIDCAQCAVWNQPHEPFKVYGNTYYVGTQGLGSILIVSPDGMILVDGGLPQSAPVISGNIKTLGFDIAKVKLILNSHPHYDHAGGIRALKTMSQASVASSGAGADGLERGGNIKDDPQYAIPNNAFPPVSNVQRIVDGQVLRVGSLAITAHLTPGHSPGGVTWTWKSCEAARCLDVVYADSLTAVSADGYRFTGDASHPSIEAQFRHSIAVVEQLPCDILLTPHPDASKTFERQARGADAFVDGGACRAYAAQARTGLDRRVAEEAKGK